MNENLITKEGFKVGYDLGADFTPIEYLQRSNPRTAVMPRGFRKLLYSQCGSAWQQISDGGKVHGFRFRDIIEG